MLPSKGIEAWREIGCFEANPRSWWGYSNMLGGKAVDDRGRAAASWDRGGSRYPGNCLLAKSPGCGEVCPANCQGRRRKEVAMTTEVERGTGTTPTGNIHVPEKSFRDAEDVVLVFRPRRR